MARSIDGSSSSNQLHGAIGKDLIRGLAGNDTLHGHSGSDTLDGGSGNDVMYGGSGSDIYIVDSVSDIVVESASYYLPPGTGVFEHDIRLLSVTAAGELWNDYPSNLSGIHIVGDGETVFLADGGGNLLAGDTNDEFDIFGVDVATRETTRISVGPGSVQANDSSFGLAATADGRYVVFDSYASNLISGDSNGVSDIFLKDMQTGALTRISTTSNGTPTSHYGSHSPDISANGRYVVFETAFALSSADTNGRTDIYRKDLLTGNVQLVSTSSSNGLGNSSSQNARISDDGNIVLFSSDASNLIGNDGNALADWFVKDLTTGATTRVVAATGSDHHFLPWTAELSGNGQFVVFTSADSNLVAGDSNGRTDVFLKHLGTGEISRISTAADGTQGDGTSEFGSISADGRYVAFSSWAENLVGGTDWGSDVFVKDRLSGEIAVVSTRTDGQAHVSPMGSSDWPRLSADGTMLVFRSSDVLTDDDSGTDTNLYITENPLVSQIDEVRASVDYVLPDNIENLVLTGTAAINGSGNALANRLTGNDAANTLIGGAGTDTLQGGAGNDTLDGGTGNDTMTGGTGNDIYYVRDTGDVVVEAAAGGTDTVYSYLGSHTLGAQVENGRIMKSGAANLAGNALNNILYAGSGDNAINGGSGNDTVSYQYATAGVTVTLSSTRAQQTQGSGSDTLTSIERLYGSAHADSLSGNAAANLLRGYAGNDTLNGGTGNDTMDGGTGNDIYYVREAGDVVIEAAAGGNDRVYSYLDSYTLGNHVESGRIMGTGPANLAGNALNNILYAGSGDNVLDGGSGNDTVSYQYAGSAVTVRLATTAVQVTGGSGNDTLIGIERLFGSAHGDRLTGNSLANLLRGDKGNDTLSGGSGNDTIDGGAGRDSLVGGSGADVFDFNAASETGATSTTCDVITDFTRGEDRIDLSTIDANAATTINDAFTTIIASNAAFTAAGQLRLSDGVLYGNTDGDADAEFAIALTGISSVASSDFIL